MLIKPPTASYFDVSFQELESRECFDKGLRYIGHQSMVPAVNDYIVPTSMDERYVLCNDGDGYNIVSNVCLHRQARLLSGSGNSRAMTCKLHCWSYGMNGELRNTPRFTGERPGNLEQRKLTNWNGLLFDGRPPDFDLSKEGLDDLLSFDGYFYAGTETTTYDYNWKTFAEIYLDDYHVFSVHPGLRQYINLADITWSIGTDYSVQWVGLTRDLSKAGSPAFQDWHNAIIRRFGNSPPRYGALWIYIYPNIMIEWYPHIQLISTVYPVSPHQCLNRVDYFYPQAIHDADPSYFTAAHRSLHELAEEDAEACQLLSLGRQALFNNGEHQDGPIDPHFERGVGEFYQHLSPIYQGKRPI